MSRTPVHIGTRGSTLALVQARAVCDTLNAAHPNRTFELRIIKTTGDDVQDVPLSRIGGQGAFTAELETALRDGRVDIAVHSLKDLPTKVSDGLALGAVHQREDVHDALVSTTGAPLMALPEGAVVGTSSVRRQAQLLAARPDLQMRDIRGNVDTRLRKVHEGQYAATVLACAGLRRMDMADAITEVLPLDVMLPAPGQGALGLECRDEPEWWDVLAPLHDPAVAACVQAERGFLDACGGGCSVPVGAYATLDGGDLHLRGVITALNGARAYRGERRGTPAYAEALGRALAEELLTQGAAEIIDAIVAERSA